MKLDAVDAKNLHIHISALDLCHGTPVWDIKPYVPWDSPTECRKVPGLGLAQ